MKRIDWKVYVLLGIIVSIAIGFLYGTGLLGGDAREAGSRDDPLISQSYADSTLSRRVTEMDDRIISLEAKVKELEDEITILTGGTIDSGAAGTDTQGTTGSGTAPTNPGAGTGGSAVSAANVGKSASVTAEVVNLRESASTSSNIKKRLTPNETFTITKVDKEWYQVQLSDGTVGWVFGDYVRIK